MRRIFDGSPPKGIGIVFVLVICFVPIMLENFGPLVAFLAVAAYIFSALLLNADFKIGRK